MKWMIFCLIFVNIYGDGFFIGEEFLFCDFFDVSVLIFLDNL